jgi:hypothetical protein
MKSVRFPQLAIADLQTAWRENPPIIVLVFDDRRVISSWSGGSIAR